MSAWPIAAMTDLFLFLHSPLGEPGSGRVRYGAAMALYRDGQISADVLEVYRVASAHDGTDPLSILTERGWPIPQALVARSPVMALYAAARDYLLALSHPGAEEVRSGYPVDPGPERRMPLRPNATVDRWLGPALSALAGTHPGLAAAIDAARDHLEWVTYDAYPIDLIGEGFARGHAFASLIGTDSPFAAADFDSGLFLIAPGTLYRDHRHPAPELYAPLTGPHSWRFGPDRPLHVKPAHDPVWNPPNLPHLIKVGPVPFLSFYAWTKHVNELAEVIPAKDWAHLEGEDLG
jgi:Dimethlysulfonioproprionate lyase